MDTFLKSWIKISFLITINLVCILPYAYSQILFNGDQFGFWSGVTAGMHEMGDTESRFPNVPGACGFTVTQWQCNAANAITTGTPPANGFNTVGYNSPTIADARINNDFIWFDLSSGTDSVHLNFFNLNMSKSSTGPKYFTLEYATSTASTVYTPIVSMDFPDATALSFIIYETVSISIPPGQTYRFRLVAAGATSSTGTLRVVNSAHIRGITGATEDYNVRFINPSTTLDTVRLCDNSSYSINISGDVGDTVYYRRLSPSLASYSEMISSTGLEGMVLADVEEDVFYTYVIDSVKRPCYYKSYFADTLVIINQGTVTGPTIIESICAGSSYLFHGIEYDATGIYEQVLTSSAGCDSIVILNLTVEPIIATTSTHNICSGGSFEWAGIEYTTAGTYPLSGTNAAGCDTVHNLIIIVDPILEEGITATICEGSSYNFYGTILTESGTYTHTLTDGVCDTLVTLTLTVDPIIVTTTTHNICAGGSFEWAGVEYTTAGTYALSGTNAAGCDTVHNLIIIVDPIIEEGITATICEGSSYNFYGTILTEGGTYAHTLTEGVCDTLVTLTLTVDPIIVTTSTHNICAGGSFEWAGVEYTTAGTYALSGTNAAGCDTVHNLIIIVDPIIEEGITATICEGSSYNFYGTILTESGTYAHTLTEGDCDTLVTLTLTVDPIIVTTSTHNICSGGSFEWAGIEYTTAGTYPLSGTNAAGCDTVHNLIIIVDPIIEEGITATICEGSSYNFYGTILTEGGTYTHTLTEGVCDTLVTLTLTVEPIIATTSTHNICSGGSFEWAGIEYTTAGTYPLSGTNAAGCDTVHNLIIIVDPIIEEGITATICEGSSYNFYGTILTESGTYTHTLTEGVCDTLVTLNLTVDPIIATTSTHNICSGGSFEWAGVEYTTAGTYPLSGTNAAGCDTVHNLIIIVDPIIEEGITATICEGSSYNFYGTILTESGTYTHTLTEGDCDTLVTLTLTVEPIIVTTSTHNICSGGSFEWAGVEYTTAGTYALSGTNAAGCDTVHNLIIEVDPIIEEGITATICEGSSYNFYGTILTESGTYAHTLTEGVCDTLVTLTLTVDPIIVTTSTHNICAGGSFEWAGIEYTAAGTYPLSGTNAAGCDTVHNLIIIIDPIIEEGITATICEGSSYNFYGTILTEGGTYTHTATEGACDSLITLELIVNPIIESNSTHYLCAGGYLTWGGITYTTPGIFVLPGTTEYGCDTIHTLTIFVDTLHSDTVSVFMCEPNVIDFYGTEISTSGVYTHLDTVGCDTFRVMFLTVYDSVHTVLNHVVCEESLPSSVLGIDIPLGSTSMDGFAEVSLSTLFGCDSIVTINLSVIPSSNTYIDTFLCYGQIIDIAGTTISSPGIYNLELVNVNGCDSIVVVNANYSMPPVFDTISLVGCDYVDFEGRRYFESILFTDTFESLTTSCDSLYKMVNISVLYAPKDTVYHEMCQGEQYDFNGRIYTNSTIVTDTFLYDNGCDSTITLILEVHPLPNVRINVDYEDDLRCIMDTILLKGSGANNYKYYDQFNAYIGSGNEVESVLKYNSNSYSVVGVDSFGCVDSASVTIFAESCCEMMLPNAFSPNNDGLNDEFGPVTRGYPESFKMEIYNRFGELVFVSYNINSMWKGELINGQYADIGTYFYVISGICFDGSNFLFKGDVTLLR